MVVSWNAEPVGPACMPFNIEAQRWPAVGRRFYTQRSIFRTMGLGMRDLNDLYLYAQVVDHGGFAAAGRALGIPKSRLSRRVAVLEKRLGVRLIQRSDARRFAVTDIGRTLLRPLQGDAGRGGSGAGRDRRHPRRAVRHGPADLPGRATRRRRWATCWRAFMAQNPRVDVVAEATNRRVDVIAEARGHAIRVRGRRRSRTATS